MSIALTRPWSVEEFFASSIHQDGRYEFDGFAPVAMTGGNANHSRIAQNIYFALTGRLRGTPCGCYGPDLGVRIGNAIRYPDALVTCVKFPGTSLVAPNPIVVFEVLSPSSGGTDLVIKLREYQTVQSILHYVVVQSASAGLQAFDRPTGDHAWTARPFTPGQTVLLDAIGIEIPVIEFYDSIAFE